MAKRRGIYTIVQYLRHPVTGEVLFNEDMLASAVKHKSLKKCAVIYHKHDKYHQSDIDSIKERLKREYIAKQNDFVNEDGTVSISCDDYVKREMETTYSYIKIGEQKGEHVHIVIFAGDSALDTELLASWFGVPENLVEIHPKGRGNRTWYDCLKYLTHKTPKAMKDDKHIYDDSEVLSFGEDFDYIEEIAELEEMMEEYGQVLSPEERLFMEVLQNGKTPRQIQKEYPLLYVQNRDRLIKLYGDYVSNLPQPAYRINFYIEGRGGEGKGQLARALARALFPDITDDRELYCKVGAKNVTFEKYRGQPVLIWDDYRAIDIITALGGRGNAFEVLNTFPEPNEEQTQHVKFSSTNLVNKVNIINSVQPYREFMDSLASGYDYRGEHFEAEDKNQSYRRFPIVICLHEEDFDVLLNTGYFDGAKTFQEYISYSHIKGNFAALAAACKANSELKQEIASDFLQPVLEQYRRIEDKLNSVEDEAAIREQFKDGGQFDSEKLKAEEEARKEREKTEKDKKREEQRRKEQEKEAWEQKYKEEQEKKRKNTVYAKAIRMWQMSKPDRRVSIPDRDELVEYLQLAEEEYKAEAEAGLYVGLVCPELDCDMEELFRLF